MTTALKITAEIIAVGSELLTPSKAETNSLYITGQLNAIGLEVSRKTVVGDGAESIAQALLPALQASSVVILSGGLGPTTDDITRETVSRCLHRPLHLDSDLLEGLENRFRKYGSKMTANNRRQALVPEGAQVLPNPNGSAPGLALREGRVLIFLLPGPPMELQPMVRDQVVPMIQQSFSTSPLYTQQLRVASLGESRVDALVESIYREYSKIEVTILSSPGLVDLFFYWRGPADEVEANRQLEELKQRVCGKLGDHVFAHGDFELETVVGRLFREKGLSLATAESCTGGQISKLLTDIPGSSSYFAGGIVCYGNQVKLGTLGVGADTLDAFGAVSEEVAGEMASGVCRLMGTDVGLSVTGVAGPAGGTEEKPVGLVYFGLCKGGDVQVQKRKLFGNRETIRLRASRFGLDLLRRSV